MAYLFAMEMLEERFADVVLAGDAFFSQRLVFDPHAAPMRPTPPRKRDYYELFLLLSGRGDLAVLGRDGQTRVTAMRPGQVYLWRPHDYRYDPPVAEEPIEFIRVGIRAAEWQAFTSLAGIPPARQGTAIAPVATFDAVEDDLLPHFETLVEAAASGAPIFALIRFLTDVVPRLYYRSPASEPNAVPWLFTSVEAMRDEQNLRIGMPRFRELTRVSARQLSRLTHQYFGMSPGEILTEARMRLAMRLLSQTQESMSTIAERCGYGTPAHFSYRFRNSTGITPGDFRRRSLLGAPGVSVASPDHAPRDPLDS
jgi:AraC-like DNA-binding protein